MEEWKGTERKLYGKGGKRYVFAVVVAELPFVLCAKTSRR